MCILCANAKKKRDFACVHWISVIMCDMWILQTTAKKPCIHRHPNNKCKNGSVFYGRNDKWEFSHFDLEFKLQIETNKLQCCTKASLSSFDSIRIDSFLRPLWRKSLEGNALSCLNWIRNKQGMKWNGDQCKQQQRAMVSTVAATTAVEKTLKQMNYHYEKSQRYERILKFN